jgi:hypothetical protein
VKFLVDADVLSEPTRRAPNARAVDWLRANEAELATSPVVVGEIEYGILLLPAGRRRAHLQQWFAAGVRRVRALEFDAATASAWARLLVRLKRRGRAMPIKDSLIAASALVHGLAIVTRNTADYRHAGVALVNPFA